MGGDQRTLTTHPNSEPRYVGDRADCCLHRFSNKWPDKNYSTDPAGVDGADYSYETRDGTIRLLDPRW